MSFHVGDKVRVNKDITRVEGPYAQAGEQGTIIEIFRPQSTGAFEQKQPYAKVRIIRKWSTPILTFRITSLERVK